MPRRKKKRRKRDKRASALTIGAFLTSVFKPSGRGKSVYMDIVEQDWAGLAYDGREVYLGIDENGHFHLDWVLTTYLPMIVGYFASKMATKFGLNRELKKLPWIGKYVKL